MDLVIDACGMIHAVYAEAIDLARLGDLNIARASHVEPDDLGRWWADLAPVGGPWLGPFDRRSEALVAERRWLDDHWLATREGPRSVGTSRLHNPTEASCPDGFFSNSST
jgi:hypothetical protein